MKIVDSIKERSNNNKNPKIIIITFLIIFIIILVGSISFTKTKKINIDEIILKDKLPDLDKKYGEIVFNNDKELEMTIYSVSQEDYLLFKKNCISSGYTIDAVDDDISYKAFNEEGFKLELDLYETSKEMSISIESPKELHEFNWPTSEIASSLPTPQSNIGLIEWENSDGFVIYVGNTSKEVFNNYIEKCINNGYNIDYRRGDDYYYAYNSKGYALSLNYEGNQIMFIRIDEKNEDNDITTQENETTEINTDYKAVGDSIYCKNFEVKLEKYEIKPKNTRIDSITVISDPEWIGITLTVKNTTDKYTETFYNSQVKIKNSNGEFIEPSISSYEIWGTTSLNSPELAPKGYKTGYIQFSNNNDDNSDLTLLINCKDKLLGGPTYSFKLK